MPLPNRLQSPAAWIAALALVLALLLPGLRGTWDPDEGRYSNVAMHMVDSGNWLEPSIGTAWAISISIHN